MSQTNSSKLLRSSQSGKNVFKEEDQQKCKEKCYLIKSKHSSRNKEKNTLGMGLSKSSINYGNKQNTNNSCFSQIEQDCLKTIITQNAKYYQDKTKVCCSTKPTKQRLILPSHTGNSIYKHDYIAKGGFDPAISLKFDEYKSKSPFMNTSNYNASFVPHKISPRKRSLQNFDTSNDAPRFLTSQYKGDFKKWDPKTDNIKVEYPQNFLLGIGQIPKKTVYGSDFLPKGDNRLGSCKYPDSAMFTNWNGPKNSHYQDQYIPKSHYDNSNFKLKNTYLPTVGLPNYNSEYKHQFDPKKIKHCSYRKVLTVEELQNFMLGS